MLKQSIPYVDLRGKSLIDLLRAYPDKARDLVKASRRTYGAASYVASALALPLVDRRSHAWLKRTANPYLYEIETFADLLGTKGIYMLNVCYEWACTTGVWRTGETNAMLRILDWPFPSLGQHVMVVLQQGKTGEFYNVTWPGMSGVFTAMAPGRFAAALNQAPMRKHNLGFIGDWYSNRLIAGREPGIPAAHLLRQVFEQASSYEEAKECLVKTPLAVPSIFTLAGTKLGQGCVIERLENAAEVRELSMDLHITTTNHFNSSFATFGHGWRPREIDSAGRFRQSMTIAEQDIVQEHFSWLRPPMINGYTRLCVITDAAAGRLQVQGFEGALPVTNLFQLPSQADKEQPQDFMYA